MELIPSFNSYIEKSVIENWDLDALTDYMGVTLQYKDVARKIEKLHIMFENSGIVKGDKIAICGRNSANWAVAFLATLTYGAVAVPIQHEFTPEQMYNVVNHSESKLLFAGDVVAKTIDATKMPNIEGVIHIPDYSLLVSRTDKLTFAREHLNELFGKKYPKAFRPNNVHYYIEESPDELALINYTSGTTGFSKGVMLPYRALWGNLDFTLKMLGSHVAKGSNTVSILPMAHMYGMSFEFLFQFCHGCHIFFLTRLPSPAIIAQAFKEIKPSIIIAVPLVIEKIIRKRVFPKIQTHKMRLLMNMPVISKKLKQRICEEVFDAFGGNLYEIVVGGAPFNKEVESFLKSIDFPITVGYGATECAPIITYSDWKDFVPTSCGKAVIHMEVKIDSPDPENIPGELLAKGTNTMLGYYKNEEATKAVLDDDGWLHTGDIGTITPDGTIFIKGRSKTMILTSNGQNIYPEEIEAKLNNMPFVMESLVVERNDKLVALVCPDYEAMDSYGVSNRDLPMAMEEVRQNLNKMLAPYEQITRIQLYPNEFEKTPKRSIKRYLYDN